MDKYTKIINEAVGFDTDIETETLKNKYFRKVLFTASNMQLVVMSIKDDIGMETHDDIDQFFRVEGGTGKAIIAGRTVKLASKTAFIVPKGTEHNVINTGKEDLKLYTLYAPPNHPPNTIHKTKEDAVESGGLEEAGFEVNPRGWDQNSIQKYTKTFTKKMKGGAKAEGFFSKCVEKMKDKMDNPEGFCASLKDEAYGSTGWRGKDKSKKEVSQDVKKAKFKVESDEALNQYLDFINEHDVVIINDGAPIPNELIKMLEYDERPNWIGYCFNQYDGNPRGQIKCLEAVKEYSAANPFYQYRVDRYIDSIMDNWDGSSEAPYPTKNPDEREIDGKSYEAGYTNHDELEPGVVESGMTERIPSRGIKCDAPVDGMNADEMVDSDGERKERGEEEKFKDYLDQVEKEV
jgi:mannose-6-phosphate isomerase-like protein (cupin superfamily)